ncbi:hypothetical protein ES703_49321 [subsurface metagenome]
MLSTKQAVFTLIIRPANVPQSGWVNPTATDIQHGLLERSGISRTSRQIRRLLRELEQLGLIRKEDPFTPPHPLGPKERAARYKIVHPDRILESRLRIQDSDKLLAEQERRRRKRKEASDLLHVKIKADFERMDREQKEAGA